MILHEHEEKGKHCHSHAHQPKAIQFNRAFLIAIVANGLFVFLQIVFAYFAHSTSLLADAVHNLGDVLGLVIAGVANRLLKQNPTKLATYGMKKTSILAALMNGILLVFTCGIIATEAMYKLFSPTEVQALAVMIVAGMGIIINGATAALFFKGSTDLNIRAAFLHLLYDALISFGVLATAALLYWTGWMWIDPVVGLMIALLILKGTWTLFTDSFRLIIDGVPRNISWSEVRETLAAIEGVEEVHDLHIWAISTQENALSVHLYLPEKQLSDERRQQLLYVLREKHNIHHATIQVEKNLIYCEDACKPTLS